MLVILKIPLIYLGVVVWWAVRAEPEVADGGDEVGVLAPLEPCELERPAATARASASWSGAAARRRSRVRVHAS